MYFKKLKNNPYNCIITRSAWVICQPFSISAQPVHPKGNHSWIFIGRANAEAETPILWPPDAKKLTHWKRPWCWERLKVGGEGDDRGWDGWMASPTQWAWVWASSGSWWWTGRPGVCCGPWGRKELDTTERLNWTELNWTDWTSNFHVLTSETILWTSLPCCQHVKNKQNKQFWCCERYTEKVFIKKRH